MEMGWYPHSGKCDFADHICIATDGNPTEAYFKNIKVYVGTVGPLRMDSLVDAIPYFPYPVTAAVHSEGKSVIYLGTKSYIDEFEEERRHWDEEDVLKYLRRCKRKKIEPSYEDWKTQSWHSIHTSQSKEIYTRISQDPKNYDISDIHFSLESDYRVDLMKYASSKGLDYHPLFWEYQTALRDYVELSKKYDEKPIRDIL